MQRCGMGWFLTIALVSIVWALAQGTSSPWSSPQHQLCCPKVGPECSHCTTTTKMLKMLQHFLSHQPVQPHSLTGSSPGSGIPTSSQGNPFLSSYHPHQIIPWSGITIAQHLQFELSLLCHTRKQVIDLINAHFLLWNTSVSHWHIHFTAAKHKQRCRHQAWTVREGKCFPHSTELRNTISAGAAGWALGGGSPRQDPTLTFCPSKVTGTCGTSQGNKLL